MAVFVWLVRRDLAARDKQMTRLLREEKLGILQVELANKKTLKLSQLRSFSRVVRSTGSPPAAHLRQLLQSAAVLTVATCTCSNADAPAFEALRPEASWCSAGGPAFWQVLAAGTPQQVADAVQAAEPYKEALAERGVLLVPLPIYAAEDGAAAPESAPLTADDLR